MRRSTIRVAEWTVSSSPGVFRLAFAQGGSLLARGEGSHACMCPSKLANLNHSLSPNPQQQNSANGLRSIARLDRLAPSILELVHLHSFNYCCQIHCKQNDAGRWAKYV